MRKTHLFLIVALFYGTNCLAWPWGYRTSPLCKKALALSEAKTKVKTIQIELAKERNVKAPEFTVFDVRGGRLLLNYLNGYCSIDDIVKGEDLMDEDTVLSNLAEMSLALADLKSQNRYGENEKRKVDELEMAIEKDLKNSDLSAELKSPPQENRHQ